MVRKESQVRHCEGCPWHFEKKCLHHKAKEGKPFPGCVDYGEAKKPN